MAVRKSFQAWNKPNFTLPELFTTISLAENENESEYENVPSEPVPILTEEQKTA